MDTDEYRDDSPTIYAVSAWIFVALAILAAVVFVLLGAAVLISMVPPWPWFRLLP